MIQFKYTSNNDYNNNDNAVGRCPSLDINPITTNKADSVVVSIPGAVYIA